jgi:hypothetical protein
LAIVGEIAGSAVSAVARRHNMAASLLFRWKRELGGTKPAAPEFVRIGLAAPPVVGRPGLSLGSHDDGAIEIVLSGGRRVIVGKSADMAALREVIAILEAR